MHVVTAQLKGVRAGQAPGDAPGYDEPSVLDRRYDFIVAQDVIEHVDDPHALLERLDSMLVPGGLISIGTPDAARLDLADPEDVIHELHAPYHRHILTAGALATAGERRGWSVVRRYDTMYNNTLFPTMNPRFALHYVRCNDDVWDLVAEPPRLSWKMLSLATPLFAFFGYFFDRHTVSDHLPEARLLSFARGQCVGSSGHSLLSFVQACVAREALAIPEHK